MTPTNSTYPPGLLNAAHSDPSNYLPTLFNAINNWIVSLCIFIFGYARWKNNQNLGIERPEIAWYARASDILFYMAIAVNTGNLYTSTYEQLGIYRWKRSEIYDLTKHPYNTVRVKQYHYFDMLGYFIVVYFSHASSIFGSIRVATENGDLKNANAHQRHFLKFTAYLTSGAFFGLFMTHTFICSPIETFWISKVGGPTCSPFSRKPLIILRYVLNVLTHLHAFQVPYLFKSEKMWSRPEALHAIVRVMMLTVAVFAAGTQAYFMLYTFATGQGRKLEEIIDGIQNIMFWGQVEVWVVLMTYGIMNARIWVIQINRERERIKAKAEFAEDIPLPKPHDRARTRGKMWRFGKRVVKRMWRLMRRKGKGGNGGGRVDGEEGIEMAEMGRRE